jgi:carbamoyltransferase
MLVLGINGCFSDIDHDFIPNLPVWFFHDAAAVLMEDNKVVAAIEEERLNRIKHTNKFCVNSIRYCLEQRKVSLADIDYIGFFFSEAFTDIELNLQYLEHRSVPLKYARELIVELLEQEFGYRFPKERIVFVPHHLAHAYSTFFHSGFDEALVVVVDGQGDNESMTVLSGRDRRLEVLKTFPPSVSLGFFYRYAIELLGYSLFDEYKVMGLAPYGDPERFRAQFQSLYTLLPDGEYQIDLERVRMLFLEQGFVPRRKGEAFTQIHKDFAASLQEAFEAIGTHVVAHWRKASGHTRLCLAGGVAHNCSLNGKLLSTGLFDEIFVHPASHEPGAALGAAMYTLHTQMPESFRPEPLTHVYWGTDVGTDDEVQQLLEGWRPFISFQKMESPAVEVARLMADGAVVGWVQGRSEYGPRALGNRSILADPRVADNKHRINAMVKKREGYRPFAPSVLVEAANEFFQLPQPARSFGYMVFTVDVQEAQRERLGAITHVDGTARIQTVDRESNPKYWDLINEFGKLTGVPIVLNTSFNNNVEPIVDSCLDAITCYLTTGLTYLVINNFLIQKLPVTIQEYEQLSAGLVRTARLREISASLAAERAPRYEVYQQYTAGQTLPITAETYQVLKHSDGKQALRDIYDHLGLAREQREQTTQELIKLWEQRLIVVAPGR